MSQQTAGPPSRVHTNIYREDLFEGRMNTCMVVGLIFVFIVVSFKLLEILDVSFPPMDEQKKSVSKVYTILLVGVLFVSFMLMLYVWYKLKNKRTETKIVFVDSRGTHSASQSILNTGRDVSRNVREMSVGAGVVGK